MLTRETADGKWRTRPDGLAKVTGAQMYLTDLTFPGMLFGKVLRSAYPHAVIESIDTTEAERLPGVHAVLTHRDVPGMNRFGIVIPDQPVFCEDRVRFVGDAICAVAADSFDLAEQALSLIEVGYHPLPVVTDVEDALEPSSPKLHPRGNVLHHSGFHCGDVEHALQKCSVIVEETYETPRQMHAYMETEGGTVVPGEDGSITVYMGSQHGYRDAQQLARILAMPENKIRIVSSPMGGSFGGKDELNLQPYAALLALATRKPVKMQNTRAESVRASLKRHPMKIHMLTGADAEGHILAHEVRILADTGAYATLGPAVLDFAVEHATGPYLIPNVNVEGISVYTNNGVAGEFRGFGGNQVTFALEGQMDRLAAKLGMDPWEIRRRNLRKTDDVGPLGQRIAPTDGALQVLNAVRESPLWQEWEREQPSAWKRVGTGFAITMHGGGLGFGRQDMAGGRLRLCHDGKIEVSFGLEEVGQGLVSVIEEVVSSELSCSPGDLRMCIGDTGVVPPSGSTTASRATHVVYQSIRKMKQEWVQKLLEAAARFTGQSADELRLGPGGLWSAGQSGSRIVSYRQLALWLGADCPKVEVYFPFPTIPDAVIGGHYLYTFAGVVANVQVNLLTGHVQVRHLQQAVAAGPVISPMGYLGQIEGGSAMALGFTLMEDAAMVDGEYRVRNFDDYLIPTIADVPLLVDVDAIEALPPGDPFGPRGVGEIGTVAVAPAVVAAIHDAIGYFPSRLSIRPEEILKWTSKCTSKRTPEWASEWASRNNRGWDDGQTNS